jgi:hypothetical protein
MADVPELEYAQLLAVVETAREMRSWQRRYFKERTQSALTESKRLEKELGALLAKFVRP